jgi:3-deoxy-D-manno-octulosonic-acid transferase
MSALLPLYRLATTLAAPLIAHHLNRRLERGKEDRARFGERLGQAGLARPDGPLVWTHAASVGESLTMLPLVEALLANHPELRVLITSGTVTSARLLAERLPEGAFHQYVPVDRAPYVNAFLDHWRPNLVLWAESEFWPNLTTLAAGRGIPMILVNGRVSPESFARWRRWPGLAKQILQSFRLCLAQAEIDAERLRQIGAGNVVAAGNLKFAVPPLPADDTEFDRLKAAIGDRPLWLAASTHPGEEELIWQAHREIAKARAGLLTIIVPRHPERGGAVAGTLSGMAARVARRANDDAINTGTNIYVADTLGELGLFFRLAPVSFMGKSLVDLGGQNPIEPARLGSAILFGPHMWNFPDVSAKLVAAGGAETVSDAAALAVAVTRLLGDPALCRSRAEAAQAVAEAEAGVLEAVLGHIEPFVQAAFADEAR